MSDPAQLALAAAEPVEAPDQRRVPPAKPRERLEALGNPEAQLRALPDPPGESDHGPAAYRPPNPRLEVPAYDLAQALALERDLGVSHPLAQILVRRGLADPAAALAFLEPSEHHEPTAFAGIGAALELISGAIARRARIVVHGDYDVDGICATAVLVRALRALGADPGWFLPNRMDDGYGLSEATVRQLAARGCELLITVDCGITAVEPVALARRLGVEVVISDHHAPRADGELPDCPIVHPAIGGYPCPDLCGTGVAFKLAQALAAPGVEEDVELVALATVADLMPLQGENRRLVRDGVAALSLTSRPGLRALMSVARVDPSSLDAHALGFRLAPRINACGRIRRPDAGLELLLTADQARAAEIAGELDALNAERRAIEQRIVWEAERQAAERPDRPAFVLAGEDWHPGVIGIVASRIVERYHRPAVVIATGDDGWCQGSGRSIPGFDLLGALHATAGHLERYGGHRAAAGLTLHGDHLAAFASAFEQHAAAELTPDLLVPVERVDAVVSGGSLGLELAAELTRLEPCGLGNPGPRLLVPGARFEAVTPMGEGRHARFTVLSGGARARAVAFGCDGRLGVEPGEPCEATFRLERNVWNGAVEPRLVLRQAQSCGGGPIEVVGEPPDYVDAVMAELAHPLDHEPQATQAHSTRTPLDRRGESPLAVLADARSAGGRVLAVCCDVPRRLEGLANRGGGFALVSHAGLRRRPELVHEYEQLVVLDPPTGEAAMRRLLVPATGPRAPGFTHLSYGDAELRFAQRMNELEYRLRDSLVALYRAVRERGRVAGAELEHVLRGEGRHGRPPGLAARLVRVLRELELVNLDSRTPALAVSGSASTRLERSAAYRAYTRRYEDGQRFLSRASHLPSA